MINYFGRIYEEVFPILIFSRNKKKLLKAVKNIDEVSRKSASYIELEEELLVNRIKEEHERAVKIDEKTSKFILGLSVSLTVLAAASGAFTKYLPENSYTTFVSVACGISAIYMLLAGITALGALKTLTTYGYGTQHLLKKKSDDASYLSEALYSQEQMNIIRQLRNEAAYQSLRNGFVVLLVALIMSVYLFTNHNINPVNETDKTEVSKKAGENKELKN